MNGAATIVTDEHSTWNSHYEKLLANSQLNFENQLQATTEKTEGIFVWLKLHFIRKSVCIETNHQKMLFKAHFSYCLLVFVWWLIH